VYLLDDHDIVRQGIRDLLGPARDVLVVGDSGLAQTAPAAILRLGAEVMVLDLHLPDGSGVHVCRQVRSTDPSIRGLLVTSADDDDALAAAVLAGASGFVVKLARSSSILGAIRALKTGRTHIDQTLTSRIQHPQCQSPSAGSSAQRPGPGDLRTHSRRSHGPGDRRAHQH